MSMSAGRPSKVSPSSLILSEILRSPCPLDGQLPHPGVLLLLLEMPQVGALCVSHFGRENVKSLAMVVDLIGSFIGNFLGEGMGSLTVCKR
jgi:hypothetical protein